MSAPRISVVIPTRGRPGQLARCLAALGATALPASDLEVVVVGDGEDVAPPAPCAAGDVAVVWLPRPRRGPAAARNAGAAAASAEVVAFTDDDCAPAPDWAPRMLAAVEAHPGALVGGHVRNGLPDNPWSAASHHVLDVFVELYNRRPGAPGFAPTSNLAMRRALFSRLGGLDERFGSAAAEDRELCDRAAAAGHPVVLEPRAVVDHLHHMDLRGFLRQSVAYGRGEVTYRAVTAAHGRAPDVMTDRFYRELVVRALRGGVRRGVPIILRVAASQAAFRTAFAVERRRAA